jgi:hypothetical protein
MAITATHHYSPPWWLILVLPLRHPPKSKEIICLIQEALIALRSLAQAVGWVALATDPMSLKDLVLESMHEA